MSDSPSPQHSSVIHEVTEGLTVVGETWGKPGDSPVLMLHGAGQNRHAWRGSAAALARSGYSVLTIDARGHGDSDWSADANYAIETMAADIQVLIDRFDRPPVIVGASMGGMSALGAQRVADRQLFASVVLVDITPNFAFAGARRIIDFMGANPEGFASLDEAADAIAAYNPHRPRPANSRGLSKVLRESDGRWHWRWDPRYILSKPGFGDGDEVAMAASMRASGEAMMEGAQALTVPTLLVRGGQSDLVTAESVELFLTAVPSAEFVDVAGTGHMVAGDDNDAFTSAVMEFLLRVSPPA
ncbi:MAG: alpha/beta fold hydrolase [Acidimicrobiales bacterium]|jgi:pimeloyl-ACP methyl ester carboxylesterase